MHKSVLLEESIDNLNLKEESIVVDCTLGYGGHSSEILKRVKRGFLFAFDQDSEAIAFSQDRLSKIRENEKLILRNISNRKIGTSISQFEITAKSQDTPYDNFYNTIKSDMLIAEAYVETYESLQKLMEEKT